MSRTSSPLACSIFSRTSSCRVPVGEHRPQDPLPTAGARCCIPPPVGRATEGLTAALQVSSALVPAACWSVVCTGESRVYPRRRSGWRFVGRVGGEVASEPVSVGQTGSGSAVPSRLGSGLVGSGLGVGAAGTRWQPAAGLDGRCCRRGSRPEWAHPPGAAARLPVEWLARPWKDLQTGQRSPWLARPCSAHPPQDHHARGCDPSGALARWTSPARGSLGTCAPGGARGEWGSRGSCGSWPLEECAACDRMGSSEGGVES